MNIAFDAWQKELLLTGDIVQDGDESVPQSDREQRFNRYVEMVDAISGSEGVETFIALVDSLQAEEDYGAYQTTYRALWRFPASVAAQGLIAALPRLIERHPDCAGDILGQLANATREETCCVVCVSRCAGVISRGCAESDHEFCGRRGR